MQTTTQLTQITSLTENIVKTIIYYIMISCVGGAAAEPGQAGVTDEMLALSLQQQDNAASERDQQWQQFKQEHLERGESAMTEYVELKLSQSKSKSKV